MGKVPCASGMAARLAPPASDVPRQQFECSASLDRPAQWVMRGAGERGTTKHHRGRRARFGTGTVGTEATPVGQPDTADGVLRGQPGRPHAHAPAHVATQRAPRAPQVRGFSSRASYTREGLRGSAMSRGHAVERSQHSRREGVRCVTRLVFRYATGDVPSCRGCATWSRGAGIADRSLDHFNDRRHLFQ